MLIYVKIKLMSENQFLVLFGFKVILSAIYWSQFMINHSVRC